MQGFNKYYPPDYDPQKHTSLNAYRGKHALGDRARKIDQGILITRFELPFNIWCEGCNNHIGMGVRYNAEKKKVGSYYTTPIYQFRCKCHLCDNWFTIETDPKNTRYVVTSGARKKDEDWNPEEHGGFAIHDPDKAGPSDPLAALEKTTAAEAHAKTVTQPRLAELQALADHYAGDPFTHSSRVRKHFREEKKVLAKKRAADDAVKGKYALPEELVLVEEDEAARLDAKEEFARVREDMREAQVKRLRLASETVEARSEASLRSLLQSSKSKSRSARATSSLRDRLLKGSSRSSGAFQPDRPKPPDSKILGVLVRK